MTLARSGYRFPRVAGTSAGAVVGSVVAALQRAGEPLARLEDIVRSLDYRKFRDRNLLGRLLGPLGSIAEGLSLLVENGVYEGHYLVDWLGGVLGDLGVRTFGDLRLAPDPADALPPDRRYALVVTASDVSRRELVRLPWDYADYGLDPDEQRVVDAVRASASIPFFFEPVRLQGSTLVDGGLLSNYPIDIFDRKDEAPPRFPTFGVRLSARPAEPPPTHAVHGPLSFALAVAETAIGACDARHINDPCVLRRTIFADSSEVSAVDFDLTGAQQELLLESGRQAAHRFLAGWDWAAYLAACRGIVAS
jgi:NTE family protein